MFPLVAPLDMVTGKLPELTEPWADIWEPPNYMPGGMYMGIVLSGHPVVLKSPLDFMVALIGHLDRPVQ